MRCGAVRVMPPQKQPPRRHTHSLMREPRKRKAKAAGPGCTLFIRSKQIKVSRTGPRPVIIKTRTNASTMHYLAASPLALLQVHTAQVQHAVGCKVHPLHPCHRQLRIIICRSAAAHLPMPPVATILCGRRNLLQRRREARRRCTAHARFEFVRMIHAVPSLYRMQSRQSLV